MLNYKTSPTEIFSTKNIQNPYTLQDMSVCTQINLLGLPGAVLQHYAPQFRDLCHLHHQGIVEETILWFL